MYNNTEATIDKIWKTVENVWNETSSSEVARASVLAYRVMDVIVVKEDDNNVRRDFKDTTTGIKPMLANYMFY